MRLLLAFSCGLSLIACAPARPGRAVSAAAGPPVALLVYIIDGDGDYTYHDDAGNRHRADEEALAQAREVARAARGAEVFVFHRKRRSLLGVIPLSGGRMEHYRRGERLSASAYPGARAGDFAAEAREVRPGPSNPATPAVLVYMGHGLLAAGASRGLARFAAPKGGKPFSLVVLSACHGGTPAMALALSPLCDWLLASPGELHLSYLDTRPLAALAPGSDPRNLGDTLERASYARLQPTRTAITLALYRLDSAAAYARAHPSVPEGPRPTAAYADCSETPGFGPGGEAAGAFVLYRPPRFGPEKAKASHSGFECGR